MTPTHVITGTTSGTPVHPWHLNGRARCTYFRYLVARNVTDTLVVAGAALALFGYIWGFAVLAGAIASDVYARRSREASWALVSTGQQASPSLSPVPTPAAVAALHGLATFLLYLAAAAVLAAGGELGAFLTAVMAAANLTAAGVQLARKAKTGTAVALLSAGFSLASSAACIVLLFALGGVDLSISLSYCAAAVALAAACLLLHGGWRLLRRVRHSGEGACG